MALLTIYLQDHLALATAGIRLARRCRGENREGELARFLDRLVPELEQDRAILVEVAEALGARRDRLKEAVAIVGELLGRLKPNGRIVTYSELSRVWELEALVAGTTSRLSAWDVLARLKAREPRLQGFAFEPLAERAKAQREALERFHRAAAESAFAPRRVRLLAPATSARGSMP
ncbi:MAG TPA: hypothetical protein VD838_00675 [Anaeromyxobacteraceae bacterium]|nr:hypothetical protein [Anaeromyxobacteraceae bacterium]